MQLTTLFSGWGDRDIIPIPENFILRYPFTSGTKHFLRSHGLPSHISGFTFDADGLHHRNRSQDGNPIIGSTPQGDPILIDLSARDQFLYIPGNISGHVGFLNSGINQIALSILRYEVFEQACTALPNAQHKTEFPDINYNVFQLDLLEIDRQIFSQSPSYWINHLGWVLANRENERSRT